MTSFVINLHQKISQFLQTYNCSHLNFSVDKNKKANFGDFATNVLLLMRQYFKQQQKPFDVQAVFTELSNHLASKNIAKIDYMEPGFINITLHASALDDFSKSVSALGNNFGKQPVKNFGYYLELVSANPTGFLHIGHARNGVFGDTLANLLEFAGYSVYREYLINNVGVQIRNLAYALYVRYVQLCGVDLELPQDSYHGQDIILCAQKFHEQYQEQYVNVPIVNERFVNVVDQELFANFATDFFLSQIRTNLNQYQIQIDY